MQGKVLLRLYQGHVKIILDPFDFVSVCSSISGLAVGLSLSDLLILGQIKRVTYDRVMDHAVLLVYR